MRNMPAWTLVITTGSQEHSAGKDWTKFVRFATIRQQTKCSQVRNCLCVEVAWVWVWVVG